MVAGVWEVCAMAKRRARVRVHSVVRFRNRVFVLRHGNPFALQERLELAISLLLAGNP